MYKVTIKDINQLRKITGYGVMDCKRALIYSKGNIDKSIEILIKKGEKISISNNNGDGVVLAKTNNYNNIGSIIKLNCETYFVSKNKDFIKLSYELLDKSIYVDTLKEFLLINYDNNISVRKKLLEYSVIFGEKITLSNLQKIQAPFISYYVHNNYKIASLVGFSSFKNNNIEIIGKNIAMQVAAMQPIALDENNISYDIIKKEINFIKNNEKKIKSKFILDKIIKVKLKKFINDNTLLNQSYIKNNNITVREYIKKNDENLKILDYKILTIYDVFKNTR